MVVCLFGFFFCLVLFFRQHSCETLASVLGSGS